MNAQVNLLVLARPSRALALQLAAVLLTLTGMAGAAVREEVAGVPFYARVEHGFALADGQWAAIPLYRPADCVPADFNLLDFFDPQAFGCPSYVDGFAIWKNPEDLAPIQSELQAVEPMPILFAHWDELADAMTDDVLTIGELLALPSLRIGWAAFYQESQRPTQPGRQASLSLASHGLLEDGTRFSLHFVENDYVLKHASIQFD